MTHKSGFVNIMGEPNVGKSTLLNALIGEKLCITNKKPQTTRHRIIAILNDDDYQIVFSDTPGIIYDPGYKMQQAMNSSAYSALHDADILLFMVDSALPPYINEEVKKKIEGLECPKILLMNKQDLVEEDYIDMTTSWWQEQLPSFEVISISALENQGIESLLQKILSMLPEGPVYYPKDQFTDRSERFFVSEIIRDKILELYHQEIPYSCQVIVNSFKESDSRSGPIIRISADIIVSRKTQKSIIIGKGGSSIKELGTLARKDIEAFLEEKVFLELYVRVKEKWRDDDRSLKSYGYLH